MRDACAALCPRMSVCVCVCVACVWQEAGSDLGSRGTVVINKADFYIPSRPGSATSRPKVMHFSRPLGKVNVVYKPLWLRAAGQWWQLKQGYSRWREGTGWRLCAPVSLKEKEMTCRLLANQH